MKRITISFGLLSGAIIIVYTCAVFMVFGDFSHISLKQFKMLETLGYLRYIILLLTVFFAMRTFKKQNEPPVKYWPLVKQNIMVIIVVAVCIGIMEYVYFLLNPDFFETYGHMYAQQLKISGATTRELSNAQHEMNNYKWMQSPVMMGIFYFFETFAIGGVASLILARFLKTK